MPIGLTEAAAIAAITGVVITGANELSEYRDSENAFERLRQNMDNAARSHPRVVKHRGCYWFYHKNDFSHKTVGGVPVPIEKKGRLNQKRRVVFRANDGWHSNNWTVWKKYNIPHRGDPIVKRYSLTNDECAEIFSEKYFEGEMVGSKLSPRNIIKGVA